MFRWLKCKIAAASGALLLASSPVFADAELSFYTGYQSLPHSTLTGTHPSTGAFDETVSWTGKPFAMPPYYGARATWWRNNTLGFGVELTHTKAYAPDADMPAGFDRLEFTDGHNILTVNVMKRWPDQWNRFTPYVGAGVGIAIPHVDSRVNGQHTYGYQITGPALRLTAGASYDLNDRWALFGEYQFIASDNEVDLDGGGSMETRLITNALNFGVSFGF